MIQSANLRALTGGVTTDQIFAFVKDLRREINVPMVFMTYANVVFSYGLERFLSRCKDVAIDGLILPDLPFEEKEEFLPFCRRYGVDLVSLIAPTSENRIARIAKEAEGFLIYRIQPGRDRRKKTKSGQTLLPLSQTVRENTRVPCAIGFGISTPEQAGRMADLSDGVIVGSAIVRLLERYGKDAPKYIGEYVKKMKAAL